MFDISVERLINKDIEHVFGMLSDHASYQRFKGVDKSSLITKGPQDINGIGAVREIVANGSTLHEEIVEYNAPMKIDGHTYKTALIGYKIVFSKPLPYQHLLGEVHLQQIDDHTTHAKWISKGTINIPILGKWYFDKKIQTHGARAFGSILKYIDTH